jgi:hypothetical protein
MKLTASIVIASAAKQSSPACAKDVLSITARLDCFAALAMTVIDAAPVSCHADGAQRRG